MSVLLIIAIICVTLMIVIVVGYILTSFWVMCDKVDEIHEHLGLNKEGK